jgi:hypothetical protein
MTPAQRALSSKILSVVLSRSIGIGAGVLIRRTESPEPEARTHGSQSAAPCRPLPQRLPSTATLGLSDCPSQRHSFFIYNPPCIRVISPINTERESSGNANHHRPNVQTMNTRRSFIKASTGEGLAFGLETRLASASTSGNTTFKPAFRQITCSLQGPRRVQNHGCEPFERRGSGLSCTATCEISPRDAFTITSR